MPRPKSRATAPATKPNGFLDALKFCAFITKDMGPPNETHVSLGNNWAVAFNGIVAAGYKTQEDIYACPNNKLLIEALTKCGDNLSITQLDNNRLSIKSDKFKAIVPCIDPIQMYPVQPDAPIAEINDKFKMAVEAVGVLVGDDPDAKVYLRSVLLSNGSTIATNGQVIFEYWHGIDLPNGLALPKSIINPLVKNVNHLAQFGFSNSSVTFYFENESWIKTQLFADQWPEIRPILDKKSNPWPVPPDFFKALAAVAPFSGDGKVYFENGLLCSHPEPSIGASYEITGLPRGPVFSARQLALIQPYAQQIDFLAEGPHPGTTMAMFFGQNIRGALTGWTK